MPHIVTFPNIPPVDSADFDQWLTVWHEVDQEQRLQMFQNVRSAVRDVAARAGGGKRKEVPPVDIHPPQVSPSPVVVQPTPVVSSTPVVVPTAPEAKAIQRPTVTRPPQRQAAPKVARTPKPVPPPQPATPATRKTRQRLDLNLAKRATVTPVQVCGTCQQAPALAHGYCESCWQMWLNRHKTKEI